MRQREREGVGTRIIHSSHFGDPQRLVDHKVSSRKAGRSGLKVKPVTTRAARWSSYGRETARSDGSLINQKVVRVRRAAGYDIIK